jgi:hypothetical protein
MEIMVNNIIQQDINEIINKIDNSRFSGKTILLTATFCAAIGIEDPWKCKNHVENGQMSKEEIAKITAAVQSDKFRNQLNQMSVSDAEEAGLI